MLNAGVIDYSSDAQGYDTAEAAAQPFLLDGETVEVGVTPDGQDAALVRDAGGHRTAVFTFLQLPTGWLVEGTTRCSS